MTPHTFSLSPKFLSTEVFLKTSPVLTKLNFSGDSGGALFLQTSANRYEQIGVTSFGIGCGKDLPAVYTKVSTSLDWIRNVIKNSDTCQDSEAL